MLRIIRNQKTTIILGLIILIAALLRFYNLNWDNGNFFHPDERNIANAVVNITLFSQMDPKFYAYGGFLIYLYKFTSDLLTIILNSPEASSDWGFINVIGRTYSAFFSTITIVPLYLLAKKVFGKGASILCCTLYALSVGSIQTAHFATTENLLTLLIILLTYIALLYFERPSFKLALTIGIILGVAGATKTTGFSFAIVPIAALLLLLIKKKVRFLHALMLGTVIALVTILTFSIFSPYTFLNSEKFIESMQYESSVVRGTNPVPYTLQFTNTRPYIFQLVNLFWQLGPVVLIALLGIVFTIWEEVRKRRIIFLVLLSFPVIYFLYIGSWHTKFIRYMVLLLPFFLLFGSNFIISFAKHYRLAGKIIIAGVIGLSLCYAIAFFSIYTSEQTRITASKWIYQNVAGQSLILTEHWDEGLPIPLPEGSPGQYTQIPLTIYDPDNEEKILYYATELSQADYIVINSRRLYGTLLHLPEKYPITKRYYELLFNRELGYVQVAEFSSYPKLFGVVINDDLSEETFQVYDHPKVLIFKNIKRLSFQDLKTVISQK